MARFPIADKPGGTRTRITSLGVRAIGVGIAIIREFAAFVDIGAGFPITGKSRFAHAFKVSGRVDAIGIGRAIVEAQCAFVFREGISALTASGARGFASRAAQASRIAISTAPGARWRISAARRRNQRGKHRKEKEGSLA